MAGRAPAPAALENIIQLYYIETALLVALPFLQRSGRGKAYLPITTVRSCLPSIQSWKTSMG